MSVILEKSSLSLLISVCEIPCLTAVGRWGLSNHAVNIYVFVRNQNDLPSEDTFIFIEFNSTYTLSWEATVNSYVYLENSFKRFYKLARVEIQKVAKFSVCE